MANESYEDAIAGLSKLLRYPADHEFPPLIPKQATWDLLTEEYR
jgi:hypothetical protein